MADKVYNSVAEMFAAITDQDGVLHPTQYVGDGPFIRLSDSKIVTLAELQDNPEMYISQSAGTQNK
jgi:hypothetical protein